MPVGLSAYLSVPCALIRLHLLDLEKTPDYSNDNKRYKFNSQTPIITNKHINVIIYYKNYNRNTTGVQLMSLFYKN